VASFADAVDNDELPAADARFASLAVPPRSNATAVSDFPSASTTAPSARSPKLARHRATARASRPGSAGRARATTRTGCEPLIAQLPSSRLGATRRGAGGCL
jgi:hypothetical protein